MPVRALTSSVLKWPNREQVDKAVREWAAQEGQVRPEVLRIGYFGSYARGDYGVASDVDLVVLVAHSDEPQIRRSIHWDTTGLPVHADLFIYTAAEWGRLQEQPFGLRILREVVWTWPVECAE